MTPDVDRIKRQQDFMKRLANIAVQRSLNDPFTANSVVDAVLSNLKVDTGLSKDDLLNFIDVFRHVNPNDSRHVDFRGVPLDEWPAAGWACRCCTRREPAADAMLARLRDFNGSSTPAVATTTTTAASTSSTAPGLVTTTTVTTPAPVANQGQLGNQVVRVAPC